jgi:hypothetical protein
MLSRHSQAEIAKNPLLKDVDLEKTIAACDKFKEYPSSISCFVEGSRFTLLKKAQQKSPFTHLLKPKAGGISFVLNSLQHQIKQIVNVTIAYPDGKAGFWDFICGRISRVKMLIELMPVTPNLIGDYAHDAKFKKEMQEWLNNLWAEKDKQLTSMLSE